MNSEEILREHAIEFFEWVEASCIKVIGGYTFNDFLVNKFNSLNKYNVEDLYDIYLAEKEAYENDNNNIS